MEINSKKYPVCSLDKLKTICSYGCQITINGQETHYFLVYHDNQVYSYLNQCPHTGINLNWMPNQFLDRNNELIQCATHGALFNIEDGFCIRGPCVGDRLHKVKNVIIDNHIHLIL